MNRQLLSLLAIGIACLLIPAPGVSGVPAEAAEPEIQPYDGRIDSPCPPESIAALLDDAIAQLKGRLSLDLVPHLRPSTQPAERRATWVVTSHGRPVFHLSPANSKADGQAGLTARALKRVRMCLAEHHEARKLQERPKDWQPEARCCSPAYQAQAYGIQIVRMELVDAERERWKVTAAPVRDGTHGGEIWMTFDADSRQVSMEFGK